MGSSESTMKPATILILFLVILGATAQRRGRKRALLEKCGIERGFCERGQRPDIRPLEGAERPEREACEVETEVTKNICILCVKRRGKKIISATGYQVTGDCTDDCKRDGTTCLDKQSAECSTL